MNEQTASILLSIIRVIKYITRVYNLEAITMIRMKEIYQNPNLGPPFIDTRSPLQVNNIRSNLSLKDIHNIFSILTTLHIFLFCQKHKQYKL